MRIIYMILSGALLTSCAAPCPVVQPRYTCPPELGTTWATVDEHGCTKMLCAVGGRGGFVDAPNSEVRR